MRYPAGSGPYIACAICGTIVPLSLAQRHYKSRKWVDRKCADQIGADDLRALVRLPDESGGNSPQPVPQQGADGVNDGYGTKPYGEFPNGDPTS